MLYDLDNPETDDQHVPDISEGPTTDHIRVGSKDYLSHTKNLKDYHVDNTDVNDPWKIPERGYLFTNNRYLREDTTMWTLPHYEYFTLEVWIRFD